MGTLGFPHHLWDVLCMAQGTQGNTRLLSWNKHRTLGGINELNWAVLSRRVVQQGAQSCWAASHSGCSPSLLKETRESNYSWKFPGARSSCSLRRIKHVDRSAILLLHRLPAWSGSLMCLSAHSGWKVSGKGQLLGSQEMWLYVSFIWMIGAGWVLNIHMMREALFWPVR